MTSGEILVTPDMLSECAREPIHMPGRVQPVGVLFALDERLVVLGCSASVNQFLGRPLSDILDAESAKAVAEALADRADGPGEDIGAASLQGHDARLRLHVHAFRGVRFVELTPEGDGLACGAAELGRFWREAAVGLGRSATPEGFCQPLVEGVRRLTGYDRVMAYRFDDDYNGEVIAESRRPGDVAYLGLWFPASDIPSQARELYLRNRLRMLADAEAEPVPVEPEPPEGLDLTFALLRDLSPIHREYLRNLGVRASLVASVVVAGRLWGLIVCHHHSPRFPAGPTRELVAGAAEMLSAEVRLAAERQHDEGIRRAQELLTRLPEALKGRADWADGLVGNEAGLMAALGSAGLAVVHGGRVRAAGATPSPGDILRLTDWLESRGEPLLMTSQLGHDQPEFAGLAATASGLLALRVPEVDRAWVMWFRPEVASTVRWAGDPRKGVAAGPETRLGLRRSFAEWLVEVRGRSRPWMPPERFLVAEAVRINLLEVIVQWQRGEARRFRTRFELVFAQVNDALVLLDDEGRVTRLNEAATWLFGHTWERASGGCLLHRVNRHDDARVAEILEAVRDGTPYEAQWVEIGVDDRLVWADVRAHRLIDEDGKLLGFCVIARDVTARKLAEEALLREREFLRTVIDAVPVFICVKDAEGRFLLANRALADAYGLHPEKLLGKTDADFSPTAEQAAAYRADEEEVARSLKPRQVAEEPIRDAAGQTRWLSTVKTPLLGDDGKVRGILAVAVDITERRATEAALRESERRFRAMANDLPALIWKVDTAGNCTYVNRAWCEFTGTTLEDNLGRGWVESLHKDDLAQFHRACGQAYLTNGRLMSEHRLRRLDGETRWFLNTVSLRHGADGRVIGFIGSAVDVTERKAAEEACQASEERLRLALEGGNSARSTGTCTPTDWCGTRGTSRCSACRRARSTALIGRSGAASTQTTSTGWSAKSAGASPRGTGTLTSSASCGRTGRFAGSPAPARRGSPATAHRFG